PGVMIARIKTVSRNKPPRGPSTSRTGLLPFKKSHLRADTLPGPEGSRARQWHGTPRTCTEASPRTDCVLFSDARSIHYNTRWPTIEGDARCCIIHPARSGVALVSQLFFFSWDARWARPGRPKVTPRASPGARTM